MDMDTMNRKNRHSSGFTMIELLIAMAIIGILLGIAYPSYINYLHKSRRTDAMAMLAQDQIILERCYSQNFSYSAPCGALPAFPQTSPEGFYSIAISNLGTSTYTLTATPQGAQADDARCASMSVNQANVKLATDSAAVAQAECWNP